MPGRIKEEVGTIDFRVLRPRLLLMESTTSTNDIAKDLAREGAREGTVVVSKTQTHGRGRYNRQWLSPEGGLYASFILEPRFEVEMAPLLGMLMGCAVVRSLREIDNLNVSLKWPNDVMVDGKKVAGILSELVIVDEDQVRVVCGIGINIDTDPFPDLMPDSQEATSILTQSGTKTDVRELLLSVMRHIDEFLHLVENDQSYSPIVAEYRSMLATLGQDVNVKTHEGTLRGEAKSIEEDGSLIVVDSSGQRHRIEMGDVHHLRPE
jgi:BirA family biotin operon repressor/biotin-[acetyl-CoA-carboxylase] ligase